MKLIRVHIKNFRSCRDVQLELDSMHALVGANNSGKSAVLHALDFLFNPSAKTLNEESFWNKDPKLEIRVEAEFSDLSDTEKSALGPYLKPDGTFHMARSARWSARGGDGDVDEDQSEIKLTIGQQYKKLMPTIEWLQESKINGARIKDWWKSKEQLTVGGVSFYEFLGTSKAPSVTDWKEKAASFLIENDEIIPKQDTWEDNPQGYAGVLKGTLPFFILVPAVRDVTDEAKGTKTSPFGRLLYAILDTITDEQKAAIGGILDSISKQMNRVGGGERVPLIADTEVKLNSLMADFFAGCDLEIEFATPTLEVLLTAPRLYVDDGFRTSVENKGHGLQRAVIFTILRRYAELMTSSPAGKKRNLILAVEEPEIYMHPQAQRTIRRVFRKISVAGDQVLFSTHSALLVDVAYFDEIIRLEKCQGDIAGKKVTTSSAWQLPMRKMIVDIEERRPNLKGMVTDNSIRELYSNVYNPRRNEGFFASKIILVEGPTEEYSLPIYADAIPNCSLDPLGISVVESGGKGSMDRLFRIFNELHIPCYMLFDFDKNSGEANRIAESNELLRLAGEEVTDSATFFVGDHVAFFVNEWEQDLKGEIPDHDALVASARGELGLNDSSGKPLIARAIARKLTAHTPAVIPVSIKAILEKAVSVMWRCSSLRAPSGVQSQGPMSAKSAEVS